MQSRQPCGGVGRRGGKRPGRGGWWLAGISAVWVLSATGLGPGPGTGTDTGFVPGLSPALGRGPGTGLGFGQPFAATPQGQPEPAYVGSAACRPCHLREYRSWQRTAHGQAFGLLSPGVEPDVKRKVNLVPSMDFRANEYCLGCHTVGYGKPGGFTTLEESAEDLLGVGCEACHGPGGEYIHDDVMGRNNLDHSFDEVIAKGLVYPVPEELCRRCHGGDTPFNAALFPEYTLEYSRQTLGEEFTHVHLPLKREHGPLPDGVMFQGGVERPGADLVLDPTWRPFEHAVVHAPGEHVLEWMQAQRAGSSSAARDVHVVVR